MRLTGKTREEIDALLRDRSRSELVDLIFSLVTFERLLTAREIAEASHVAKRDILAEMRVGRFVDPIFGAGFFCRAGNSLRVSASAANAWRESFFVPVALADSIPCNKKERFPALLQSAEDERRRAHLDAVGIALTQGTGPVSGKTSVPVVPASAPQTDLKEKTSGQKAVRDLSPWLTSKGLGSDAKSDVSPE